jgi:hypothetical protein
VSERHIGRCCLALLLATACAAEDPGAPEGSSAGGGADALSLPYAPCPSETGVGEFSIELGPDFTSAQGKVLDGVMPNLIPTALLRDSECQLLSLPTHLCDPGCPVATQTCGADNHCIDLPAPRSVGTVSLSGLVVPVEMTPNAITGSYRPKNARLPHPAYAPGASLGLYASGGDYAAFELQGWGVSELELLTSPVHVDPGQPTRLAWKAPERVGPARVQVSLHLDNHGSSNASIECDFADDGVAEIPAALVDALFDAGHSGYPTITLTRRTATSTGMVLGCVQLLVASSVSAGVSVSGLSSCNDSSMCPSGQTCRALERFCE